VSNAVERRAVSRSFGFLKALGTVGHTVPKGSIHAVVGEYAAGKTTLMRILYGTLRPAEGDVIVEGIHATFGQPENCDSVLVFNRGRLLDPGVERALDRSISDRLMVAAE
jgi:ABC-type uncharacterized transport system ATPase subunit